MNLRTHIVVRQTASGGLEMLSDAQPEQMARNVARDLPGSHAVKFDEIGNTMNTTTQATIGFIGKCTCKGCKTVLRVNIPAYERKERRGYRYSHLVTVLRANEHPNDRQICCAEHKRYLFFRQIDGKLNPEHVCDSRCTGARGHSCECSCGGANHGMDYCR